MRIIAGEFYDIQELWVGTREEIWLSKLPAE